MANVLHDLAPSSALTGRASDIPATIIAMEQAALDRSDKLDVDGFLEISDPDVVYIDPFLERPIVGLENLRCFYKNVIVPSGTPVPGEMLNAKVQVLGDTVVLTFNYRRKDGLEPRWNATEVYRRTKAGWRIMHTHWSFNKSR